MKESCSRILDSAVLLFRTCGLKKTTMDDVAKKTGISKKTLYANFQSKDHLVQTIVEDFLTKHSEDVRALSAYTPNALVEYFEISKLVLFTFRQIEPTAFLELKKYHLPSWVVLEHFQKTTVAERIKQNLQRGIKEGIYRSELSVDFIARLYALSINNIINKDLFPEAQFPLDKNYMDFFAYHASGICSEKGKKILTEIVNSTH